MAIHSVSPGDLVKCKQAVDATIAEIGTELSNLNASVESQHFIGTNATQFALDLNTTVDGFVLTQMGNLNEILSTVTNNMNVVITKLGGAPLPNATAEELVKGAEAKSKAATEEGQEAIDTEGLTSYATELQGYMDRIAESYQTIGPGALNSSNWIGPEQEATVQDVTQQVSTVVMPNIQETGAAMAKAIDTQVQIMGPGAA